MTACRGRLHELTAEGWFRLALLVLGVLVVAAALVVLALLSQNRTAVNNLAGSIEPAQAQAYRLQGALVDQETGVRGYAITGDSRFLAPYTSGRAIETSAVARLRALIGGKQPMAADLSRLERAANGWRHAYALPLINLASHGPLNGHDLAQVTASKQSFDHLRVLFAAQNHHLAEASAAGRRPVSPRTAPGRTGSTRRSWPCSCWWRPGSRWRCSAPWSVAAAADRGGPAGGGR